MTDRNVNIEQVRDFWEANPLSSSAIPHAPGTVEYFEAHNRMREAIEPPHLQAWVYEPEQHRNKQVLDIGCGNGYVTAKYASFSPYVTAVDLSDLAVELTRRRLGLMELKADIRQANAEELPFDDGRFDLVTAFGVLHHTPETALAVREVSRVLRPGGKTLMMFYHRNSFAYRALFPAKRLLQPAWRGKTAQEQVNAVDGPDNPLGKVYSRKDLRALLGGFERFEFRTGAMFFRWAKLLPRPLRIWAELRWGWFLYVKAYKPEL